MLAEVELDDGPLMVPGIVPKLSVTPGAQRTNAPALGQHTEEILREAGLTDSQIGQLRAKGVIN
jgi:formyl-CoA transferase